MDFWNEFTKAVNNVADTTVKGTEKLTGIAKLKYKISALNARKNDLLKEIGTLCYNARCGIGTDCGKLDALYEKLDVICAELKESEDHLADLRDYIQCTDCGYRMPRDLSFCPKCGKKTESD